MPPDLQRSSLAKCYRLLLIMLLALAALPVGNVSAVAIIRVKPGGAGSGSSWANAASLQAALTAAAPGTEIWVAKGTYTPAALDRTISFTLKNGVAIYGGFSGTEAQRSQRSLDANLTILSGDLQSNDSGAASSTNPTRADNSYHVVVGGGTDATAVLDGVTIRGGNANGAGFFNVSGGGMANFTNGSPALANVIFKENTATSGGAIYNLANSSPTLSNVTISANVASDGGGIYNSSSSPTLTNVTISGNTAQSNGGGLENFDSSPILTNVIISGNTAASDGGGVHNESDSGPTLLNTTISGNTAQGFGGGMENFNASPTLTNVIFSNNSAGNGGGMDNNGATGSSPTLTNVAFNNNRAQDGGGMSTNFGSPMLTNVTFSGNSASDEGGGMVNADTATLANVTFKSNTAVAAGGGLYNIAASPKLTNVVFSGNTTQVVGAGMYNFSGDPSLTYTTFSGNVAGSSGGGMYVNDGSPVLANATFSSNSAQHGGGLYSDSSSPRLTNVVFSGNSAQYDGGGMTNLNSNSALTNVAFSSNSATATGGLSSGGGLANKSNGGLDSSPTLVNITFNGNSADFGGGMFNNTSGGSCAPTLTNITFGGNSARRNGGGLYDLCPAGAAKLANTILAGNTAPIGPDCYGFPTLQGYNLVGKNTDCTVTPSIGDQVGSAGSPLDPKLGPLQDNGGFAPTRALLPGSPALNKGSPLVPGSAPGACALADQRGTPRPQGGRCDIGAYEALPAPNTASTTAGAVGQPGSTNGFTTTARFDAPSSIAATADGALALIADTGNHTIRKLDVKTGLVTTLAGKPDVPGSTNGITMSARFREPYGIALTADGRMALVADTGNNTIRQIDVLSGTVTTLAGTAIITGSTDAYTTSARFNQPVGVALDAGGALALVADYGNHTIRKIDLATGQVTTLAGSAGAAGNQNGIGKAARFNHPTGVALSPDGKFALVGDTGNRAIRKIDVATGQVTTLVSLGTANTIAPTLLSDDPLPITIDSRGCIAAIADSRTDTIKRLDLFSRQISLVAGSSNNPGSANGSGTSARFNTPKGVSLTNGSNTALVADTRNNTIRRVDGIAPPKCQRLFLPLARR